MKALVGVSLGLFFILTSVARADFEGNWTGEGDVTGNVNLHCRKVSLVLHQSSGEFSEEQASATCGIFTQDLDPVTLQIRGNELWRNEQKVGDISDSVATAQLVGPNSVVDFKFTLSQQNSLEFYATITKPNGRVMHLLGNLLRIN